jgi:hypothetical protein
VKEERKRETGKAGELFPSLSSSSLLREDEPAVPRYRNRRARRKRRKRIRKRRKRRKRHARFRRCCQPKFRFCLLTPLEKPGQMEKKGRIVASEMLPTALLNAPSAVFDPQGSLVREPLLVQGVAGAWRRRKRICLDACDAELRQRREAHAKQRTRERERENQRASLALVRTNVPCADGEINL